MGLVVIMLMGRGARWLLIERSQLFGAAGLLDEMSNSSRIGSATWYIESMVNISSCIYDFYYSSLF